MDPVDRVTRPQRFGQPIQAVADHTIDALYADVLEYVGDEVGYVPGHVGLRWVAESDVSSWKGWCGAALARRLFSRRAVEGGGPSAFQTRRLCAFRQLVGKAESQT